MVFTTAYHEYAIKAFKKKMPLTICLKPIDINELRDALKKCQPSFPRKINYKELVKNVKADIFGSKIQIHSANTIEFANSTEIIHLTANGAYCDIYLTKDRKILSAKPLKFYEANLDKEEFFRINRFAIININSISDL